MAITIDDFFGLVDRLKPEDWHQLDNHGKPREIWHQIDLDRVFINLQGHIKDEGEITLDLNRKSSYFDSGFLGLGSYKNISDEYSGTLAFGKIHGEWKYILPIDKHRVAEEGDRRLKAKFDEVVYHIQQYEAKELERNEAVIRKLLKQPK
jgi:hypothetical protein